MSAASKGRKLWLLLFFFFLGSFACFFHTGQDNENARFDQIRAVVEEGSWNIDHYAGNTADVIKLAGHEFPNKAPGSTLLGLPFWVFFSVLTGALPLPELVQLQLVIYLLVLATVGVCSALTGCALYFFLEELGLPATRALFFAILYSLGTIAFPFSTVFFGHQLAASFLFLGFYLLWKNRAGRADTLQILLAGFLLGFAPVLEYPAALGTVVIGCYGLTSIRWRSFLLFFVAGLAAFSLLFFYNWSAFHQLFFVPYESYNTPGSAFPGHQRGFAGVGWPRWSVLWQITCGRRRGLFYINPWLCLILPAVVTLRQKEWRPELVVCFAMVAAFFAFDSGFGDSVIYWGGAWSIGPRHVIPMLPFMAVPIALLCRNRIFAGIALVLGAFSLLAMFCATAVTPRVSYDTSDPLLFYLRQIFLGRMSLNVDGIFADRFVPGFSFNLGQLVGLPARAQLLPLALLWGVMLPLLFRRARELQPAFSSRAARIAPLVFSGVVLAFSLAPIFWDPYFVKRPGWQQGLAGATAPGLLANAGAIFPKSAQIRPRRDADLDLVWSPTNKPWPAPFGGIWTGQLRVPDAGLYRVAIESDGESAVYLDGAPMIDHWRSGLPPRETALVELSKGFHALAIHYENRHANGVLRFFWAPPDEPMEIVPPEFLFSR